MRHELRVAHAGEELNVIAPKLPDAAWLCAQRDGVFIAYHLSIAHRLDRDGRAPRARIRG